ncbi:hypothetical protein HK097_004494, partial [Rhizophlyctis rosea]
MPSHNTTPLALILLFTLLPTIKAQWSLSGCYGAIFGTGNDWGELVSIPTTPLRAQDCVSACTNRNAGFAIIKNTDCHCRPAAGFDLNYIYVNPAECRIQCSDGFPCGDSLTPRASVYNITGTALQSPSPLVSSATSSASSISTTTRTSTVGVSSASTPSVPQTNSSQPTTTTSEGSVDTSTNSNTNRAAIIGGTIGALVALFLLSFLLFNKWRKNRRLQTIPHLDAIASKTFLAGGAGAAGAALTSPSFANDPTDPYLLPGILPRTPNMIYSVVTPHTPLQKDEVPLQTDEVVAVRGYFKDGWGVGTNVNTGSTGAFPLGCLVSDEKWAKRGFVAPQRVDSVEGARKVMREASSRRRKEYQGSTVSN